jgi:nucleotide-binding universal stress UspA family protein
MMRRILVAVDGSPRSSHVLAVARELADLAQCELRLFHVLYIPVDIPPAGRTAPDDVELRERARAQRELEKLASGHARTYVERPVIADQAIWRMIVDRADQSDIDLLVMGSHGYGTLERLLGTTAAQVVNHCKRNVLIVRSTG